MGILRAFVRDEAKAFSMDLSHIFPPFMLMTFFRKNVMQARLTQVFFDNLLTLIVVEVIFDVIRSAILTV